MKKAAKKEEKIVGACGITCGDCPAFIATQRNDDALRAKTAREWSSAYHADIRPENVNCDGCPGAGPRLFAHCLECEVRACAHGRRLVTCAACADYSCQKLDAFLSMMPDDRARKTLAELRKAN
jgi:hypothetical protein